MPRMTGYSIINRNVGGNVFIVDVTKDRNVIVRLPDGTKEEVSYSDLIGLWSASWNEKSDCLTNEKVRRKLGRKYYEAQMV